MNKLPLFALTGALALSATLSLIPDRADACIHPEKEFQYPIRAGAQKGLIFFADGRQEMVIRPSYEVDTEGLEVKDDAVKGFNSIAWLVPVPNLPDVYKEADNKLFSVLEEFTEAKEVPRKGEKGDRALGGDWEDEEKGAEFLEVVKVGDYTIQPVKAKGELGALELNGWLSDNGFGKVAEGVMKYYIDNNYYWLAVKLKSEKGLPADGAVKPLRIGFDTDKPVYPLKINEGRGEFDLELWVITNRELDTEKTVPFGLQTIEQQDDEMEQTNRKTKFSALPTEVKDAAKDDDKLKKLKAGELYCYRFFGLGIDDKDGGVDLSKLKEDLNFSFKEAAGKNVSPKKD